MFGSQFTGNSVSGAAPVRTAQSERPRLPCAVNRSVRVKAVFGACRPGTRMSPATVRTALPSWQPTLFRPRRNVRSPRMFKAQEYGANGQTQQMGPYGRFSNLHSALRW